MTIPPNEYTYSILFQICAQLPDRQSFEFGQSLWKKISLNDRKNPVVSTSFLQMLIKHKEMSSCEQFFSQMSKNNITFTIMMKGRYFYFLNRKLICFSKVIFLSKWQTKRLISFVKLTNPMR